MGFLHHLAGMALGALPAGAARPSLPSRFAELAFTGASQGQVIEQATPAILAPPAPPEVVRGPRSPAMPVAPFERRQEASQAVVRPPHPPSSAEPQAVASHPVRQDREAPPPPPNIVSVVERRSAPEKSSAVIGEAAVPPPQAPTGQHPPVPPQAEIPALPQSTVTRAAPLSPAVVAGRAMAVHEQAPVIHVTIDRLDVRAPVRAEPARQRPRPQPTVSLSDYLRDGASGGRR